MVLVKNEKTGNEFEMSVSKVQKLCKKWIERLIGFDCFMNEGREEPLSLGDCLELAINGDEKFIFFLGVEKIKFTEKDEFILNFIQLNAKAFELNLGLQFKFAEEVR